MGSSDCVAVSGAGSAGDPFVPSLVLSEDVGNALECRDDGLFASLGSRFAFSSRTSGNLALSSTTWADVFTTMDLTIPAEAGDVLLASLDLTWSNEAQTGFLDVRCVASGNYFGSAVETNTGSGILGARGDASEFNHGSPEMHRTLVAGDISAGAVQLRLRYRVTGAKTLIASAAEPLRFWTINFGPNLA